MSTRPSEDALIARYFAPLAGPGGLSLADDAAFVMPRPGRDLVLTVDAIVADIHFFPDDPPDAIGEKALGVNLSDLAAKGADPVGFLLALSLPNDWTEAWLAEFCRGLGAAAAESGCALLGGDTVRTSGPLSISVTVLGDVPSGRMVRRTTARVGDIICVSGTIGDATLGLALRRSTLPGWAASLPEADQAFLRERYWRPQPRLALATVLRDTASAAMDISDGLAGDLAKMMRTSGTGATIDLAAMPLSGAARRALAAEPGLIDAMVTGGDDYEILCTVSEGDLPVLLAAAEAVGIALTPVGQVTAGAQRPRFTDARGDRVFERGSFSHF